MPTANFPNVISGDLTFSNITVNEVDTGLTSNDTTFVGHSGILGPGDLAGHNGLHWLAFNAELTGDGVGSAGSSIQLNFSYDVTATGTNLITGFDQIIQTDFQNGTGISASAIETITDDSNNVVGVGTWTPGGGAPLITLAQGYQHLHVSLAFTESVAADSTGQIGISILANGFTEGAAPPPLAALGDFVWYDTNDNGVQDSEENGVSGVTVELEDTSGNILSTTTTDSNGAYHFTGLTPGQYEVQFVAPPGSGDVFSPSLQGGNTAVDSNPNSSGLTGPVTLVAGETDNTIDAGLFQPPAALGDYVWLDTNNNGIQDEVGTGISGVTVELEDTTGNILSTTTTDASGAYLFTGLAPGSYEVQFIAPTGDTFSAALQGGNTATDSNPTCRPG
jgi:serine-aspartate repeat-containing protein C/D/E